MFRFRGEADPVRVLKNPNNYESLQAYLASGDEVAPTMYGPVRFDRAGQNAGREPATLQLQGAGQESTGEERQSQFTSRIYNFHLF